MERSDTMTALVRVFLDTNKLDDAPAVEPVPLP
jgi:hypothetical protein